MKHNDFISENNVANIATETNIAELAKVKNAEEKSLKALIKRNADETVIQAQQQVFDAVNKKYEESVEANRLANARLGNSAITFVIVDDETGQKECVLKKIAFVKNNRPIDSKKVDKFIHIISANKYENAYPIIVVEARHLIELGYTVCDIKGRELSLEEADDYLVILDGQHRSMAYARLIAIGKDYEIPNVRMRSVENVGEYLVDINDTGTSWSNKDRVVVAALTSEVHNELFTSIATLVNEGFNPSTSAMIYMREKLSKKLINNALKGEEITLPKDAKIDIPRGDKFIALCKAADISVTFITKRYFIGGFNSYAASTSDEIAFKALEAMKNLHLQESRLKEVKGNDDFIALLKEAESTII